MNVRCSYNRSCDKETPKRSAKNEKRLQCFIEALHNPYANFKEVSGLKSAVVFTIFCLATGGGVGGREAGGVGGLLRLFCCMVKQNK